MAHGRPAVSTSTNHPLLGPSVAIADDRSRSRGNLFLGLACVCLGPGGVLFGSGDLASGSTMLGLAYAGGGVVLFLYGVRLAFLAAGRLRHPVALIVGRDGFEAASGGPVIWDEVTTIGDPTSPPGQPKTVRVQLVNPKDYAARHDLGPIDRQLLRMRRGDLVLGRDTAMPVADVQALMLKRLAEYRRSALGATEAPAGPARAAGPRGRRPRRKRP